ncbi:MAG TPA: type VI secretion system baseplate subunit TssF [Nevskia sp.]|nr:type VI secretion system baseplate subunit TssF [Nevskia sp.]
MDPRLLRYYNRELQHVREMGGEFAREFPKIAGRLGLEGFECADPYVERLLEGFAFLAARVQLKLDAQFPVFTQHLLEMIYPHFLAPIPSMAVVQLQPDLKESALMAGVVVPRHTLLRGLTGRDDRTACEFRTAHDVTLTPLRVDEVKYLETPAAIAATGVVVPPRKSARAAIRMRFSVPDGVTLNMLTLDEIPLFIAGADELPKRLYEQLLGNAVGFIFRAVGTQGPISEVFDANQIRRKGFDDNEALIPYTGRSFSGYRLLQEYFACPERFLFVVLGGLRRAMSRAQGTEFEIVVLLNRSVSSLHGAVDASNIRLNCSPAINLFPRRADRIHLDPGKVDYHIVPDRTRPMDYEIHSISQVEGFGDSVDPEQRFLPFYGCDERTWHHRKAAFYSIRREPRMLSSRQKLQGARSSYVGNEMFISLVDGNEAPYATSLRQLGMMLMVTNRDLPLTMPIGKSTTDFTLDSGAPVESIRCVAGPTKPRASIATGSSAWRLISHLQLNYLSLIEGGQEDSAAAIREMLTLYCDEFDSAARRQIEGIKAVQSAPVVRRVPVPGPITYGRGLEITLTCDDGAFEGTGAYLFGAVMQEFLARYVSINSFSETVLRTVERNEVARWPASLGKRHVM